VVLKQAATFQTTEIAGERSVQCRSHARDTPQPKTGSHSSSTPVVSGSLGSREPEGGHRSAQRGDAHSGGDNVTHRCRRANGRRASCWSDPGRKTTGSVPAPARVPNRYVLGSNPGRGATLADEHNLLGCGMAFVTQNTQFSPLGTTRVTIRTNSMFAHYFR
jgi:hypothetical protein